MNRNDLHKIARIRLQEAEILFNAKQFDGAYYLAGYAVECALKACIAKETRQYDFPDKQMAARVWVYDLKELRRVADLEDQFVKDAATIAGLVDSGNIVSKWSEKFRYIHGTTDTTAAEMLAAVSDRMIGILPWLEKYW